MAAAHPAATVGGDPDGAPALPPFGLAGSIAAITAALDRSSQRPRPDGGERRS